MKTKPKTLGKINEREFVHALNKLMLEAEIIDENQEFKRVIGSGAHGQDFNKMPYAVQNTFVGDIHGPTNFPFVIECKRRKGDPAFHKIIAGKKHDIYDWLDQVEKDADLMNKEPLLITKYIQRGSFVVMRYRAYKNWYPSYRSTTPHPAFHFFWNGMLYALISWENFEDLVNTDFDGWLKRRMIHGRESNPD